MGSKQFLLAEVDDDVFLVFCVILLCSKEGYNVIFCSIQKLIQEDPGEAVIAAVVVAVVAIS